MGGGQHCAAVHLGCGTCCSTHKANQNNTERAEERRRQRQSHQAGPRPVHQITAMCAASPQPRLPATAASLAMLLLVGCILGPAAVAQDLPGQQGDPQQAPKKIPHGPHVRELDAFSFYPAISDPESIVFVEFYTHDCRWVGRERRAEGQGVLAWAQGAHAACCAGSQGRTGLFPLWSHPQSGGITLLIACNDAGERAAAASGWHPHGTTWQSRWRMCLASWWAGGWSVSLRACVRI